MFLHHFTKKENKHKKLSKNIYSSLIKIVEFIIEVNKKKEIYFARDLETENFKSKILEKKTLLKLLQKN